ncbi:hypothetical protein [Acaryochloris sp. CCMEE 5410]|uniref:hypothetical protein n=1 Tax=Acaryochloris sp. CCMEE 5410 TaxID=310037 RepID=UPI000248516E|nr:hypothetical protein [Acaryochloris sp. CCMEE 5410]
MMALILSPIGLLSMALFGMYIVFTSDFGVSQTWQDYVLKESNQGNYLVALQALNVYVAAHPYCKEAVELRADILIHLGKTDSMVSELQTKIPETSESSDCNDHELILGKS